MKNKIIAFVFLAVLTVFSLFTFDVEALNTSAKACVVMEANSGRVFYSKNQYQHLPLASTTKILTSLVIAENCNLNDVVEIPQKAVGVEGSSVYLRKGEHLTVKQLLYGLMLRSGNDCAVALALHAAGSIENFAKMMNEKAKSLGCENSNFTNPHGLPDDNHYTCAKDLGLISCEAMRNPIVKEIVSTKSKTIANEGYSYDRLLKNKNKILFNYDGANGVKTGYTKKAGRCFVGAAERDGMQLVVVLLNCGPMFEESVELMDDIFEQYQMCDLKTIFGIHEQVEVLKGKANFVDTNLKNTNLFYPLKKDGSEKRKVSVNSKVIHNLIAPVEKGKTIGEIDISFDNQLIFSSKICTLNAVGKAGFFDNIFNSGKKQNDSSEQIHGELRS